MTLRRAFVSSALFIGLLSATWPTRSLLAAAVTGHLILLVAADGTKNNTTGSLVEIDSTTANQTAIQTFSISGAGSDAYRISGSASSTGYVSLSADRTLLTFNGANNTNTSSNVNTLNPRGVSR
jgi:hypothetical protein